MKKRERKFSAVERFVEFWYRLIHKPVFYVFVSYVIYDIATLLLLCLAVILESIFGESLGLYSLVFAAVFAILLFAFMFALLDRLMKKGKMTKKQRRKTFKAFGKAGNAVLTASAVFASALSFGGEEVAPSLGDFKSAFTVEVFCANLALSFYQAAKKARKKTIEDLAGEKEKIGKSENTAGGEKNSSAMVEVKQGLAGGSGNPLEEAGNSCLRASRSEHHRDYRSRRRRTEPFSSGKRRSYRASAVLTWRRPQRGSAASAADVQQTTGFQEPPAGPISRPARSPD